MAMAAIIAIIATTIMSSIRVKPLLLFVYIITALKLKIYCVKYSHRHKKHKKESLENREPHHKYTKLLLVYDLFAAKSIYNHYTMVLRTHICQE